MTKDSRSSSDSATMLPRHKKNKIQNSIISKEWLGDDLQRGQEGGGVENQKIICIYKTNEKKRKEKKREKGTKEKERHEGTRGVSRRVGHSIGDNRTSNKR